MSPQYIFILHWLQIAQASHKRFNLKVLLDEVLSTVSSIEWLTHFRCSPQSKHGISTALEVESKKENLGTEVKWRVFKKKKLRD